MVQAGEDISAWRKVGLKQLVQIVQEARDNNQYCFIWDKQGSVATFMNIKGHLVSVGPPCMKALLGQGTLQDAGEDIRKGFVSAMLNGTSLCLDIDRVKANFNGMNQEGTFVGSQVFDWGWMATEANYMTYVRENENHGVGGINPGRGYIRNNDFSCSIRSGAEDEEVLRAQIALIPNFDQMMKVVIE